MASLRQRIKNEQPYPLVIGAGIVRIVEPIDDVEKRVLYLRSVYVQ